MKKRKTYTKYLLSPNILNIYCHPTIVFPNLSLFLFSIEKLFLSLNIYLSINRERRYTDIALPPKTQTLKFTIFPPIFPLSSHITQFTLQNRFFSFNFQFFFSMGKYMKKSKTAGDVAAVIMEAPSHAPAVGVRTRAKTLALQKSPTSSPQHTDSSAFLQLRSRRLRKVPPPPQPRRENDSVGNLRLRECSIKTFSSLHSVENLGTGNFCAEEVNFDFTMEGSFGENFLEIEGLDRYIQFQFLQFCVFLISIHFFQFHIYA